MLAERELEVVDTLREKLPLGLAHVFSKLVAAPVFYRLLSHYDGTLKVGKEMIELSGETHFEYMVLRLKGGAIPSRGIRIPI